jgi:ribosome-binding protein aMBF1 (putative translation factor)
MIAKLEKELGIFLLEKVKEVSTTHHSSEGMTLGDFIRNE